VYADFQGGMDIARGFSQIVGIDLDLNFRQPYFSHSIEDFWRRWHITLGSFMRDYVFYPLSLSKTFTTIGRVSRKILGDFVGKRLPPILAMFIVYFLVGFWHGPDWKYIAYGVWNGIFLVMGILLPERYAAWADHFHINRESFSWRAFQIVRTFCICSLGRLFSRGNGLRAALHMFASIGQGWQDLSFLFDGTLKTFGLDTANWLLLALFVCILFLVDFLHERGVHIREAIDGQHVVFRWAVYLAAIMAVVIFGSYGTGFKSVSFIYEQF
jgi:D-alanyl-lipoteichoic acid acyltransferase DltB (MBOAT superfamily)